MNVKKGRGLYEIYKKIQTNSLYSSAILRTFLFIAISVDIISKYMRMQTGHY